MGAPNSEFGCTSATTRRGGGGRGGDNEVYMDIWWQWTKIFKQDQTLNWLIYFRKTAEDIEVPKFSKLFFTDHERKPEARLSSRPTLVLLTAQGHSHVCSNDDDFKFP
jgi:hypothetical protein